MSGCDEDEKGDHGEQDLLYHSGTSPKHLLGVSRKDFKPPGPVATVGGFLFLFGGAYLLAYIATAFTRYGHLHKVNVILMISDGFGPASETFARSYVRYLQQQGNGSGWDFMTDLTPGSGLGILPLDSILVGQCRTRSSNSLVTDSAAGATAFACAHKSYNGAIAVEPNSKQPLATVLEAAKHKGYLTGLVVTSRITHATPACFYAHVVDRDMEPEIANMLVGSHPLGLQVDYALGGGRPDDDDLISHARKNGLNFITSVSEFEALREDATSLGTFGLFNLDHMNYEVDRVRMATREPSLKEMSRKALNTLSAAASRKSTHGFFLLIEGSRIDMAAHSRDPVGHLHDILAYQDAVREVKFFVDDQNRRGWPTVMISVSDHETGGLSLARQLDPSVYPEYLWYPDAVTNATHSTMWLGGQLSQMRSQAESDIRDLLESGLGITDATDAEIDDVVAGNGKQWALDRILADMISRRAQIGWSTSGHSGVDVNLYASGYQAQQLRGSRENTEIGLFISKLLDVDLDGVTRELQRTSRVWHTTNSTTQPGSLTRVAHYHGHDALSHGAEHLYLDDPA